jgi:hypothetical protein
MRAHDPTFRIEARPERLRLGSRRGPATREKLSAQRIGQPGMPVGRELPGSGRQMRDQGSEARPVRFDLPQGGSEALLRADPDGGHVDVTEHARHAAARVPKPDMTMGGVT